ncbi:acetyltransferase-like isoleucine patch superfamily enzyme [Rhodoligotrophos appendicifer]|uniref:acyltransferase n=1 Tax=Rhodoligotrophos appendicifer TaxID=987056 RepID=UPI00117E702D|nr:hypothetical protein [Rhodoligotrophos appendicifer]
MLKRLLLHLWEDVIRGVSGPVGIRLRRGYYRRRLKRCGDAVTIAPGVCFTAPECISLGDNVWIDQNCILIAGAPLSGTPGHCSHDDGEAGIGEIVIGHHSHVGIGTIIQGHGGVRAGDAFTTSAGVKIYSFSNDFRRCRDGTMRWGESDPHTILSPVRFGRNVWLGLNSIVIGHSIGSDSFVKPNAVVCSSFPENSLIEGAPALRKGARFEDSAVASR